MIHGEAGDDIREIAAGLHGVLQQANWDVREMVLGGALWDAGRGILVFFSTRRLLRPTLTALIGE